MMEEELECGSELEEISQNKLDASIESHKFHLDSQGRAGHKMEMADCDLSNLDFRKCNTKTSSMDVLGIEQRRKQKHESYGSHSFDEIEYNSGAKLNGAILNKSRICDSSLTGISLRGADLIKANLSFSDLKKSILDKADLEGATLIETDLRRSNLKKANLKSADLTNSKLQKANLTGCFLIGANLTHSKMEGVILGDADLTGATLRASDLSDVNLKETKGLRSQTIASANVSGTKLPDDVANFEGVELVNQATENARKLFVALGLACAYAALAISTTETGGGTLELPIIGLDISVRGFYFVVPVLLLAGLGYFHLQMQRVWEEIARLPAVFPDGKAVDRKITPWLVTGIVRAHVPFIKEDPPRYFGLQQRVIIVLAWGLVPLTQGYFLYRFINAFPNKVAYSILGALLVMATTIGAIFSYMVAKKTLREGPKATLADDRDTLIFRTAETLLFVTLLWQISYALAP
jgi:uncharacterized protein YjbI with pentapeptide repeats